MIRFSLEKLKDPNSADIFRATIEENFAPLLALKIRKPKYMV